MAYPRNAASPERIAIGAVVQISDGAVQTSAVVITVRGQGGAEATGGGTTAYGATGIVYYTPTQAETNFTSFTVIASKTSCIPVSVTVVTSAASTAGQVVTDAASRTASQADVTALATAAALATVDGIVDAILLDTDAILTDTAATLPGLIATAQTDLDTITGTDGVTLATAQALYAPAKAGNQMDLVNAPNATAVTAIQGGLATAAMLPTNFASLGISVSGHVSRVTLVDTTTTNTDMRGTDSAYTGTPPTVSAIADAVCDEVITGAEHNVPASLARFLREAATATTGATGTLQSATGTTAVLESGAVPVDDYFNGERLSIIEGTGSGQSRLISDSTALTDTVTLGHAWTTTPDNTSIYAIMGAEADVRAIAEQPVVATGSVDFDDMATILVGTGTTIPALIGTPAADLSADIAAVKSDTGTILGRVTATVATLWSNLAAMISGSGVTAAYTATAMENVSATVSGNVTVGSLTQAALAQFAADDTGQVTAAAGSVSLLSQGGGADDAAIIAGVVDGLATVTITRISPYDPTESTFKLIQGDDYLYVNGSHTDISLVGETTIDLTTATATLGAVSGSVTFSGTATIVDADTASPVLRLEWEDAGAGKSLDVMYTWQAKVLDASGNKKTEFCGPLSLRAGA